MSIRATTDSKFLLKYLLIGLVCLLFAAWSAYDGFVNYPGELPRAQVWDDLKSDESLDDGQRAERYKAIASEKGWAIKRPTKSVDEINQNIVWQYIFIGVGSVIGLPCILWYLRNRGTWIETKDKGLRASWGQELDFEQVTQFDKKKWEKKGIGVISYQTPEGGKTFVVDDLKYNRKNMDEIVRILESNISHELIVNGEPESDPQSLSGDEKIDDAASDSV